MKAFSETGALSLAEGVFVSSSKAQTSKFAARFVRRWPVPLLVVLTGEIGSGKTTFVQGAAAALGLSKRGRAASPTFVLLRRYPTCPPVCHADFYRLKSIPEPLWAEISEALDTPALVLLEWGEPALKRFKGQVLRMDFRHRGENLREMKWKLRR